MKVSASKESPFPIELDALIVVAHDHALTGAAAEVDKRLDGLLQRLIADGELSTKVGKTYTLYAPSGIAAKLLIVVGGGPLKELGIGETLRIAGSATKRLSDRKRQRIGLVIDGEAQLVSAAVTGALNGAVGQDVLRTDKNFKTAEELVVFTAHDDGVAEGIAIGESMLLARELINLPPNLLTPSTFTERAIEVCASCGIAIEVWDELRLRKERCGALLGVAAGSQTPPRLLILRYAGNGQGNPVALVGKGVTFDSGGLSIKPTDGMLTMKCDMAGAATVLATLRAAALLKVETPIVGLVGLVENMISGSSFKLGDVLTSRSGTTVEVHNTDAEGRLVLADVLNVALEQQPDCIIDLATLTGACVVALGTDIAGLMGNNEQLQRDFQTSAARCGELVWPLPMHRFFDDQINSQVADIKNVGDGRWGGAITAAKFLERFVANKAWLHVDIAGPAFADKPKSHQDAGGTACLLRTLVDFVRSRTASAN